MAYALNLPKLLLALGISLATGIAGNAATLNVPGTYTSIQLALNAASPGDVVLVQPGSYFENLNWPGTNNLTLQSAGTADNTVIDGSSGAGAVIDFGFSAVTGAEIIGFTIQGGNRGIYAYNASFRVEACYIENNVLNTGSAYGAGIYNNSGEVTLVSSVVGQNIGNGSSRAYGGGIYMDGGSVLNMQNVIIESNEIYSPNWNYGSGVYCDGCTGNWTNVDFNRNICGTSSWSTGAAYLRDGADITATNIVLSENENNAENWNYTPGIHVDRSSLSLNGGSSSCNASTDQGSSSGWGYSGSLYFDGTSSDPAQGELQNVVLGGNEMVTSVTWVYSVCILARDNTNLNIMNCTLADNTLTGSPTFLDAMAVSSDDASNSVNIVNSILWNPNPHGAPEIYDDAGTTVNVSYSNVRGGWPGTGNINAAPNFVGGGDYHLQAPSPGIDQGTAAGAPATDLDGIARPYNGVVDMGAYEFDPSFTPAVACAMSTIILPVTWADISAVPRNNAQMEVNWTTTEEVNVRHFVVERSTDGKTFTPFAELAPQGTPSGPANYTTTDISPQEGINYYRVKNVDHNGAYSYSAVVEARIVPEEELLFSLWPNPTQERNISFRLDGKALGPLQVSVMDLTGKVLLQKTLPAGEQSAQLNLNHLAKGIYHVRLQDNATTRVQKLLLR